MTAFAVLARMVDCLQPRLGRFQIIGKLSLQPGPIMSHEVKKCSISQGAAALLVFDVGATVRAGLECGVGGSGHCRDQVRRCRHTGTEVRT